MPNVRQPRPRRHPRERTAAASELAEDARRHRAAREKLRVLTLQMRATLDALEVAAQDAQGTLDEIETAAGLVDDCGRRFDEAPIGRPMAKRTGHPLRRRPVPLLDVQAKAASAWKRATHGKNGLPELQATDERRCGHGA